MYRGRSVDCCLKTAEHNRDKNFAQCDNRSGPGRYYVGGCLRSQRSPDSFNIIIMEEDTPSPTPTLGSSLLKTALSSRGNMPTPASSGSISVDNLALQGGFRYGEITSIAGPHGTGKTTVCRRFDVEFHKNRIVAAHLAKYTALHVHW